MFANTIARENCVCLRLCLCQQIQLLKRGMLNGHSKYAPGWHWESIMKQIGGASHERTIRRWDLVWDCLGAGTCVARSTFLLSPQQLFRQFFSSYSFSPDHSPATCFFCSGKWSRDLVQLRVETKRGDTHSLKTPFITGILYIFSHLAKNQIYNNGPAKADVI